MSILSNLKAPPKSDEYKSGDFFELPPGWRDDDNRGRGVIYDPNFSPSGGWDKWCEWAAEQGKIAHILHSRAKNAMAFTLISDSPKIQAALDELQQQLHLVSKCQDFFVYRDTFGRCFIEPVWEKIIDRKSGIKKVKNLYPPSVRVFFDIEKDVKDLKDYLQYKKDYRAYAKTLKVGPGDNIIGYVQHWNKKSDDPEKDGAIFFAPDELIFIPRYPSHRNPTGLALPRQNYVLIMNKLGIEKDQAIMAKRHGDPKHVFTVPSSMWEHKENIKKELKNGIRAGLDFFFRGKRKPDDEDPMAVRLVEPAGNPVAVIKAQTHTEDQFNAAMGWADSFTESTSSNRSVGFIQLAFFERNIQPERRLFEEILMEQLVEPWLKARGFPKGSVRFQFEDLTPEDKIEKLKIMVSLFPYLPEEVIEQYLEDLGYPISSSLPEIVPDPTAGMMQQFSSLKGIPRAVSKSSKTSREQIKEEIECMQEDIRDVLGI